MLEEESGDESDAVARSRRRSGAATERWQRVPLDIEPQELRVTEPVESLTLPLAPGLELFCRVRRPDSAGAVPVTVVLVNTNRVAPGRLRDADSFFQVEVAASALLRRAVLRRARGCLTARRRRGRHRLPAALSRRGKLRRRSRHVGRLGAASTARRARRLVRTRYLPTHELLLADSNPDLRGRGPDHPLARDRGPRRRRGRTSTRSVTSTRAGSSSVERRPTGCRTTSAPTAQGHLDVCAEAASRMRAGVDELASKTDDTPWEAFRLANRAMLRQRSRVEWLRLGRADRGARGVRPARVAAFPDRVHPALSRGIADPESEDRKVADLLWFPTGGGKTEAYLGLIAFTVFLRRLQTRGERRGSHRAHALHAAAADDPAVRARRAADLLPRVAPARGPRRLGDEPISIGLWVGRDATPNNRVRGGRSASTSSARAGSVEKENPVQLHACPWCGHAARPPQLLASPTRRRGS